MSDSDDEFGGLEPTTPYVARKRNPTVNVSDSEAGPSRNAPRTAAGKRKGTTQASDTKKRRNDFSGDEEGAETDKWRGKGKQVNKASSRTNHQPEIIVEEAEDDVEEIEGPHQTKSLKSKKPTSKLAAAAVKGKLKAKAKAADKSHEPEETMDVDDVEVLNSEENDHHAQKELANAINAAGKSGPGKLVANVMTKAKATQITERNERLQHEVDKLKERATDLQKQLEEVHKVRTTEPELLLQRLESQFQEERQVRDTLIKNLQDQLARQDPLLRSGKKSAFEVLTRDEADNEVKALHRQLEAYRSTIKDQHAALQSKEKLIAELEDEKQHLRTELTAEIERSKTLASRAQHQPPPSVNRQRIAPPNEDPKFGTVIRFYEDLTNLIIPSMKMFPGKMMGVDEWHLTCFYTYKDVTSQTQPSKSLSFTLRLCHEPAKDDTDSKKKGVLVESVQYIPLALDQEDKEFVKSLDFLNAPFTFERDQLSLFIRTLHDVLSGESDKDDEEDDSS